MRKLLALIMALPVASFAASLDMSTLIPILKYNSTHEANSC